MFIGNYSGGASATEPAAVAAVSRREAGWFASMVMSGRAIWWCCLACWQLAVGSRR